MGAILGILGLILLIIVLGMALHTSYQLDRFEDKIKLRSQNTLDEIDRFKENHRLNRKEMI